MAPHKVDCYLDLDILNDTSLETQNAKLILPLGIEQRNDIFVALTYMVYHHSTRRYDNIQLAIFDFGMPKLTTVQVPDPDPGPDPEPDPGPGPGPGFYKTVPKVEMVRCQIERAEHDGESLCNSLNVELKAKLPSQFRGDECKFIWNKDIARAEITIDGSPSISPESRATLILYWPLTYYLGFTRSHSHGASYAFGAPLEPYVKPDRIIKTSHGVAGYLPNLSSPKFIVWHLDILHQQVCLCSFFLILLCHSLMPFFFYIC